MKHYGNVTKINGAEVEPVDIVSFGSPCQDLSVAGKRAGIQDGERSNLFFEAVRIIKEMREATNGEHPKYAVWENVCFAAGTLVTCEGGYKPIERVFVGEKVKTLSGKYLPVVKVHKTKRQNVFKLSASGGEDLIVTGNHPFYARQKIYDTGGRKTITDAQWTEVKDLTEKHLIAYRIDEPILPENFISEIDAWLLGRWLADGSVDLTKATPRIFISVGNAKLEDVRNKLRSSPYELSENAPHETATNFTFTSNEFYSLIAECGVGAGQKKVASYIFTLPHRLQKCILDGYMSGDGYMRKRFNGTEITAATASRELAYGIARLVRNCHKTGANISCRPAKNGLIDGRVIKANYPSYNVTASIGGKSSQSVFDGTFVWQPVRSVQPLEEKQDVYNLSVLEDNTYAANDIICHNCGAFSSNKGHDFHAVLEALCSVCDDTVSIPKPYDTKRTKLEWNKAGEIVGDNYSVAWRTLDAQYWGVPQRRKRIYLVADFTGGCVGEILFKPDSLRGDLQEGDEAWQGSTADAVGGVDGSVGVGLDLYNFSVSGDVGVTLNANSGQSANHAGPTILQCAIPINDKATRFNGGGDSRRNDGAGNGLGVGGENDPSPTVTAADRHAVCYQESVGALQTRDYKGVGNQYVGEDKLVIECYDARENGDGEIAPTMTGDHNGHISDYTTVAVQETYQDKTGPLMANSHPGSYTGQDAYNDMLIAGKAPKPPRKYIIRRLTPTECARLQGFPDKWGHLAPYDPADAEFWEDVRKTHAEINGKKYKPVKNLKAWYEGLHTDSAEYKAYGNGLALPCAENVMRGIAEAMRNEKGQFVSEGGIIEHKGYTCIYKPDHPRARANGYVREHILVAEEMLGRPLDENEVVHHINGDKSDNRPENLMVFPNQNEHVKYHNRTDGTKYKYRDGEYTIAELAEFSAVDYATLTQRINKLKLDIGKAVETPKRGQPTLGSLFDGIGGFPLAGAMNGIIPLWASEVEPYCIAVTKSRFKEVNNA